MINKELFEVALVEMGRRVGLEWSGYDDVMAYQHREGVQWYLSKTWTKEQSDDFERWLDALVKQRTAWSAYKRKWEIKSFMLCYSWRVAA